MHVSTVTTADGSLLRSVRRTLSESEDVLMCVAFIHERGLHLLALELKALAARAANRRLLVTTTFEQTTASALECAVQLGLDVRVQNRGRGTYHPKVYLGRSAGVSRAIIGSANLTGGLTANVEAAVHLEGPPVTEAISQAWAWAEDQWADPSNAKVDKRLKAIKLHKSEAFDPILFELLRAHLPAGSTFLTLKDEKPNAVIDLNAIEMVVQTERSRGRQGPERIPALMFNVAWENLHARGALDYPTLTNELRIHRSSAVLAALARLPGVEAVRSPRIGIQLRR